jgi:ribosomal-protein-alanine N-acetyltransferase
MSIRPARSADLGQILAIEVRRFTPPGWKRSHFEAALANPRTLFVVAEEEGRVAGYACCWQVPPDLQIHSVVVAPEAARRGIGKALLGHVLAAARAEGLEKAALEVSDKNGPALGLYRSAGFEVVGRRPKFYNDGSDAVLMDLSLR